MYRRSLRMEPAGRRRHWRNIVDHAQFHAVLEQQREARTSDDLGVQLMEAPYAAIRGHQWSDCLRSETRHSDSKLRFAN